MNMAFFGGRKMAEKQKIRKKQKTKFTAGKKDEGLQNEATKYKLFVLKLFFDGYGLFFLLVIIHEEIISGCFLFNILL